MLLFALAGPGRLVPAQLQGAPDTLTAYAIRNNNGLSLTVINTAQAVSLSVDTKHGFQEGAVRRLTAPSLASTTGVTLGGTTVAKSGSWNGTQQESVRVRDRRFTLDVPAASGATVWLK